MYIFDKISSMIWGKPLIALLLATGGFYTIKLNAPQFRLYRFMTGSSKNRNNSGLSQIRTVCMSLGAAMGTGNITGVAAAVAIGGAGAVFWMWISAFFGMAVVYAENYLSVLYSDKKSRGPMAYLEKGVGSKHLACAFAVMCVLASLGMGGMVQVNSFAESLGSLMPDHLLAAIMFLLIYAVISGGAKRIGTAAQTLLPPASAVYAVICFLVLIR
ncbi:MAG TPA: alanine:cation symporter family protein, partial [Ruminococcus flavefaciens]|nr:alanine:cation symporter family protein [Ruminococcus flavefaciens]